MKKNDCCGGGCCVPRASEKDSRRPLSKGQPVQGEEARTKDKFKDLMKELEPQSDAEFQRAQRANRTGRRY